MTASSTLPFVLTDVELKNHWDSCDLEGYEGIGSTDSEWNPWANGAAESRYRFQFVHAYDVTDNDAPWRGPRYLHLADGGIVDNLGTRAIAGFVDIDTLSSLGDLIPTDDPHMPSIRQLLILEVNARSENGNPRLDAHRGRPGRHTDGRYCHGNSYRLDNFVVLLHF